MNVLPWTRLLLGCGVLVACSGTGSSAGGGGDGAAVDGAASPLDAPVLDLGVVPRFDVPVRDASDAATPADARPDSGLPTITTLPDGGTTACGPRERCGNGVDDDCNGMVDEGCPCVPGADQPCFPGDPARAGVGVCHRGTQHCTGTGEFGAWSACMGAGSPQPVDCHMPTVDTRCDGHPGVTCLCTLGAAQPCYSGPAGTAGRGLCVAGTQTCVATATGSDWGACTGEVLPAMETCDGRDHDCDGTPNSGCGCSLGATRSCYDGPAGTAGRGLCHAGTETCVRTSPTGPTSWSACTGEVLPARDVCNGTDRDCDGTPNTGCACTLDMTRSCYTGPAGTAGVGACHAGSQTCVASPRPDGSFTSVWGTCVAQALPSSVDTCGNAIDDNCNGMVDEGCTPGCAAGTVRCNGACVDVHTDGHNCGACGVVCAADQACANGVCVGNGMLRFTMVWDVAGDMDLHVVPPCGSEICYRTTVACGGQLDHDDITGTGPENVFWAAAPARGAYVVCATPYGIAGTTNATLTVTAGTTVRQTWHVNRTARSGYVACSPTSPYYVGTFTY